MARSKSAVLTASEKKAVVKDMKDRLKTMQAQLKSLNRDRNAAEKSHAKFLVANAKDAEKISKAAAKLGAEIDLVSGK